jgi:alanyl-tRNA synthetase
MESQRERARSGGTSVMADRHDAVMSFVGGAPPTRFVGYEQLGAETAVAAAATVADADGQSLVKLEESPFYAEGGGQVADSGTLRWNGTEAGVIDVYRVGDDQALRVAGEAPEPGTRVEAAVDHRSRHATMRNHTATHLLHAALRERLGTHVRQAGSAVRPDKLRFDFSHGSRLTPEDLAAIEDRVNAWIGDSLPVRAIEMERERAEDLGAMALFGEKYGDWVRMVEVDQVSRELCGGTHVANTAEIGIFALVSEGSSASNVRRVEALSGPAAIDHFRARSDRLDRLAASLGSAEDPESAAERLTARLAELEGQAAAQGAEVAGDRAEQLADGAEEIGGVKVVVGSLGELADQPQMLDLADRIRQRLGEAAVVLGGASEGKVALVGSFSDGAVAAGLSAADVVRSAAAVVGGGGGGRENVAQAGGRDPSKLGDALDAARAEIGAGLGG